MSKIKPTEPPHGRALARIERQIESLIFPDFRPLAKALRDLAAATEQERRDAERALRRNRQQAYAAAMRLLLIRNGDWNQPAPNYFSRVKMLEKEGS